MHRIAVISVHRNQYSETFIRDQIRLLPCEVHHGYGGYLPVFFNDDNPVLPLGALRQRAAHLVSQAAQKVDEGLLEKAVACYFSTHCIDAVLAHYGPIGVKLMNICQRLGLPLFVYFHGFDAFRQQELQTYGPAYPQLFRQAAACFAVSREMMGQLETLGCPREKLIYNPCGADVEKFTPAEAGQRPPIFLFAGRLIPKKGPLHLLRAFQQVAKQLPESRLIVAGDGPLLRPCQQKARGLNIAEKVTFRGAVSHREVQRLMHRARAYVQPSVIAGDGDREGTPVALLEAMASGLPMIASRHGGMPDVIEEGRTGFLFDEKDNTALAGHLLRLGRDVELATRVGQAASKHVRQHFTLQKTVEVLWKVMADGLATF